MMRNPVIERYKLALVGCGAVSEWQHLPAILQTEGVLLSALVDTERARLKQLAANCRNLEVVTSDYRQVAGKVQLAVVALPHSLHCQVACDLLHMGINVLVEKPMAINTEECDRMIRAAIDSRTVLAVGHLRRFFPSAIAVKSFIESGILGRIQSFDYQEGAPYDWPAASPSFFDRKLAGGGVLLDTGPHSLDLIKWWFGSPTEVEYYDDNMGGVEAECFLKLALPSGIFGSITLSRMRFLRNTIQIKGELATLEMGLSPTSQVKLYSSTDKILIDAYQTKPYANVDEYTATTKDQLGAFVEACRNNESRIVTGAEARDTIAIIQMCYEVRKPLLYPWENN
jgi:predicted dehydrogenase